MTFAVSPKGRKGDGWCFQTSPGRVSSRRSCSSD